MCIRDREWSAGVGGSRRRELLVVDSLQWTATTPKEKGRELVAPGLPVSRGRRWSGRTWFEDVAHATSAGIAALISFTSPFSVIGTDIVLSGSRGSVLIDGCYHWGVVLHCIAVQRAVVRGLDAVHPWS